MINTEKDSDSITMSLGYKDSNRGYNGDYYFLSSGSLGPLLKEGSPAKIGAYVSASEWENATPGATYQATVTYILW